MKVQEIVLDDDFHFQQGLKLYISGKSEEALEFCKKTIGIRPNSSKIWHLQGVMLANCFGREEEGIVSYDKAIGYEAEFSLDGFPED